MKIFNGTPHEIKILRNCTYNEKIRKYVLAEGKEDVITIPSNAVVSAKIEKNTVLQIRLPDGFIFIRDF